MAPYAPEREDIEAIFRSAPDPYLILYPDLTIATANDAYLSATMVKLEAIRGRCVFEVFPDNPADPAATGVANLRASLTRVLKTGTADAMAVQKYDVRRPEEQGGGFEQRYWSPLNTPVLAPDNRVRYIIHKVEDVTEFMRLRQRGAEQDRLTAEMRTRGERMETEILARAQQLQQANERIRNLNEGLELRVEERTAELERTQEQLRQAHKMEALGRLAGGVAHDFNNMLTVITSYAELLLNRSKASGGPQVELTHIYQAAERAAALTRQLLAFSRRQVTQPKTLSLNAVVDAMGTMLQKLAGGAVDMRVKLDPELRFVRVDQSQIEQVLANLVVNARDAMPRGGTLTIETRKGAVDSRGKAEEMGLLPGPYALLTVRDTGVGMDAETRSKVFEPFFTTKDLGHGTGLGLAIAHGVIKQAGGHICVESALGQGTTVSVYLPHLTQASDSTTSSPILADDVGGTETILLVEDEEMVRAATTALLRGAGYQILEATDAKDALYRCRCYGGAIHLLLTDVIMPGMNGVDLARQAVLIRPGMKVMYMSGYIDHALGEGVLASDVVFASKPFTASALLGKVRGALDGTRILATDQRARTGQPG